MADAPYYSAMDRAAYSSNEESTYTGIQKPIIPLYRIGQTVPEQDPSGRFKKSE